MEHVLVFWFVETGDAAKYVTYLNSPPTSTQENDYTLTDITAEGEIFPRDATK